MENIELICTLIISIPAVLAMFYYVGKTKAKYDVEPFKRDHQYQYTFTIKSNADEIVTFDLYSDKEYKAVKEVIDNCDHLKCENGEIIFTDNKRIIAIPKTQVIEIDMGITDCNQVEER